MRRERREPKNNKIRASEGKGEKNREWIANTL